MKNKNTAVAIGIGVILLVIVGFLVIFRGENGGSAIERPGGAVRDPGIESIILEEGNIVVRGAGLSKAELWYVPTGTGVTEEGHQKLGDMTLKATADGLQEWSYPLPSNPFLATELYARGYEEDGTLHRSSFGATGATEIYEALWSETPSTEKRLDIGESMTLGGITLTLNRIIDDSRCPPNANCVWAGNVQAEVGINQDGTASTRTMASDTPLVAGNYRITVIDVNPNPQPAGTEKNFAEYSIRFKIEQVIRR